MPAELALGAYGAEGTAVPPLLRGLVRATRKSSRGGASAAERVPAQQLAGLKEPERETALLELVLAEAATVLGHGTAGTIDSEQAFKDVGFDSLTAVELRNRLVAATGVRLPATLIFDYPTPLALAGCLAGRLRPEPADTPAAGPQPLVLAAELDRLEAAFAHADPDEALRADLMSRLSRLEALTASWGPAGRIDDEEDAFDFDTASDDEIFGLIDKELGSS
jgi:acyl carrier protein